MEEKKGFPQLMAVSKRNRSGIPPKLGGAHPESSEAMMRYLNRDYLAFCTPNEVAEHLELSRSLTLEDPLRVCISERGGGKYKIVVIAYDYFSAFSILCGLLSAYGLNIESGCVETLSIEPGRKKIVDLFLVSLIDGERFDRAQQARFEADLSRLFKLLDQGSFREARKAVNYQLVSKINQLQEDQTNRRDPFSGLLTPIDIRIDNRRSARWTTLSIRGQDTPAFLYAFSNALSMRNIYIHSVKIDRTDNTINNRLSIANLRGKKISGEAEKKALKFTAVLIKQFIHFLVAAPDPMMAMTHYDQFLDKILEAKPRRPLIGFLKKKETMDLLARFFGTSDFLWEDFLRIRFENFLPILEHLKRKPLRIGRIKMQKEVQGRLRNIQDPVVAKQIVNAYKDEEMFRIDIRHLLEPHGKLTLFSESLTDLAEVVVQYAYAICYQRLVAVHGPPRREDGADPASPFAICGLGKFGGRELGYASDIELLFVYENTGKTRGPNVMENNRFFELLSKEISAFIVARQEGIFSIDTRLRPHGKSGPMAISLAQFGAYYSEGGKAAAFERQAFIKLRAVAGSGFLGKKCEAIRDRFVYSDRSWDKEDALLLRKRQIDELVPSGRVNIKYSAGGLIDIEYLVQYLQIIHGGVHPALQTTNTLEALAALGRLGILTRKNALALRKRYLFFRKLIDALRMVRGNAKDLLLPNQATEEFLFLSRRMGYGRKNWEEGCRQLNETVQSYMDFTRQCYQDVVRQY
ncbi:MAG: hypothetical protein ACE5GK_03765 [Nitrospiria bacterium]